MSIYGRLSFGAERASYLTDGDTMLHANEFPPHNMVLRNTWLTVLWNVDFKSLQAKQRL